MAWKRTVFSVLRPGSTVKSVAPKYYSFNGYKALTVYNLASKNCVALFEEIKKHRSLPLC